MNNYLYAMSYTLSILKSYILHPFDLGDDSAVGIGNSEVSMTIHSICEAIKSKKPVQK